VSVFLIHVVINVEVRKIVVVPFCRVFLICMPQVNIVSSVSPKLLTELTVGTRTPLMFMCTGSVFRRYVNCSSFDFVGFTASWHTNPLTHPLDFGCDEQPTDLTRLC
jgi:hypothetical protein